MLKHGFTVASIFLLQLASFAQRPSNLDRNSTTELTVKVSLEDNSYPSMPLKVQLLNGSRTPVGEAFTRDNGAAQFSRLNPGSYLVQVTGIDIEESTPVSFSIAPRESVHTEYVTVKRKPTVAAGSNTSSSISLAALNVPEKAKREFDKGMEFIDKKDLAAADGHFIKALSIYPGYALALNARGAVASHTDRPKEAEDFFRKAIDADAQCSPAYVNLAKLLVGQKKNADAEALLTKSISQNPRDVGALVILANLYLVTGKYDDAIVNARKVHTLAHADYPVAHLIAGMALEKKQLDLEAAAEFRQFLEEAPTSASADKVKAELDLIAKRVH